MSKPMKQPADRQAGQVAAPPGRVSEPTEEVLADDPGILTLARAIAGGGAAGRASLRRFAPAQEHRALLALQRTGGNAAVQRFLTLGAVAHPGSRSTDPEPIRRQVPPVPAGAAIPGVGLALTAATFVLNARPSGTDAFQNTNVQFNYSRDTSGPLPPQDKKRVIFELDSIKGFGASFAFLQIVLRYDGQNIISAYTEQDTVDGYDGGMLGSEAAVNFSAVKSSQPTDPVTQAYVIVQGFNNPSGPGFQRFRAKILVTGDGRVEPQECALTDGGGTARTTPWCFVGFD